MSVKIPISRFNALLHRHNILPSKELHYIMQSMYEKGFNAGVIKVSLRTKEAEENRKEIEDAY